MKNIRIFLSEKFKFLELKFCIYLNRRVFVMKTCATSEDHAVLSAHLLGGRPFCVREVIGLQTDTTSLILSPLQASTDTFETSADPDEIARIKLSHQDLHCLPFCNCFLSERLVCNNECAQRWKNPFQKLRGERVTIFHCFNKYRKGWATVFVIATKYA